MQAQRTDDSAAATVGPLEAAQGSQGVSYAASYRPPRTLTRDEQARLLKVTGASSQDYADHILFAVALGTGLRVHELGALNIGDVYNVRGGARQRVTLRVFKFCQKEGHTPAPQEVFLNGALRGKLEHFKRWKSKRGQPTATDAPLFCVRSGRRMSSRRISERFCRWRDRAELPTTATFHSLRHTYCQRLYDADHDILLVQRAARHSDLKATQRYAHASDDDVQTAVGALEV